MAFLRPWSSCHFSIKRSDRSSSLPGVFFRAVLLLQKNWAQHRELHTLPPCSQLLVIHLLQLMNDIDTLLTGVTVLWVKVMTPSSQHRSEQCHCIKGPFDVRGPCESLV
jgi:hypothetical protein